MNRHFIAALRRVMRDVGTAPTMQEDIIRALLVAPARPPTGPQSAAWQNILAPLKDSYRNVTTIRHRWRPERKPVYEAYAKLLKATIERVQEDAKTYPTPDDAVRAAAKQIEALPPGEDPRKYPTKDGSWITWLPYTKRLAVANTFTVLYADHPAPGQRVQPFMTAGQRKASINKLMALRAHTLPYTDAIVTYEARGVAPDRIPRIDKERARAAYAAQKAIDAWIKAIRKHDDPTRDHLTIPINWTHVLDPDTRARLRAEERAFKDPAAGRPPADNASTEGE